MSPRVPLSGNLQGALWIIGSCIGGTVMSIGIKLLDGEIHSTQITFLRCLLSLFLIWPFLVRQYRVDLGRDRAQASLLSLGPRWRLHVVRGVLVAIAMNCGYYAIATIPLATVTVLFFTSPLFVTLFAVPILGEKVGWRRWMATTIGFVGALVVLRPEGTGVDWAMILAVGSSMLFALVVLIGKKLSETEPTSRIMLATMGVTALISAIPAAFVWITPSLSQLALIVVVSIFATSRSYTDIRGYALGEASFVAPFNYTRLIFMALAGYLIFAEVPEDAALIGAVLIIGSSLYIAQREARLKRQTGRPGVAPAPE